MLCGKFVYPFPLSAESYPLYFQARINLKALFSSSRYATFARRYSSSLYVPSFPINHGGFSLFGLHFFFEESPDIHVSRKRFFQSLRVFFGRLEYIIKSGRFS
jgi:hypothetical protein